MLHMLIVRAEGYLCAMKNVYHTQADMPDTGRLRISVESRVNRDPIPGAKVSVSYTGEPESTFEELSTNESGQTQQLELKAPPLEYSMEPSETQPYAQYTIQISADGYQPVSVDGIQVLADQTAVQDIRLQPVGAAATWPDDIDPGKYAVWQFSAENGRSRDQACPPDRRDRTQQGSRAGICCRP